MIINAAKRIFNSDKIYRSYSDLNFGVTFLEHSVYIFCWGGAALALTEFCQAQYSLCAQVLRSPIFAALLHGNRAVGVSQTLRRGTRNGISELLLLIIFN